MGEFMENYIEVLAYLAGLDPEENDDEAEIEACLQNEYGINYSEAEVLVHKLFEALNVGRSPLTDKVYVGFSVEDKEGRGFWLAKKEMK